MKRKIIVLATMLVMVAPIIKANAPEDGPVGNGDVPKIQSTNKMIANDLVEQEENSLWDWFLSLLISKYQK